MDGIHDMGGMHGFGRVVVEENEPVFHEPWEGRVLAIALLVRSAGLANVDAFRHAIERMDPADYLTLGYYGRWLDALERLLVEAGVLRPGELPERQRQVRGAERQVESGPSHLAPGAWRLAPERSDHGVVRTIEARPRFVVGQSVRARNIHPIGHTRLPRYARGRRGVVDRVHPACVFPDTHAHGLGEDPQHVYSVRFAARELWGDDAEPGAGVSIDLFEAYLQEVEEPKP
jgi:nitrile hydratase subunit beta